MVSYSAGSMNSLVDKLTKLKIVSPEIEGLKQDLVNLDKKFFRKVAGRQETNLQVEVWMNHVREHNQPPVLVCFFNLYYSLRSKSGFELEFV